MRNNGLITSKNRSSL